MSDQPHQQEKTEAPSPKRRKQFRERGDIAKSKEIGTAALFLITAGVLAFGGAAAARCVADVFRFGITSISDPFGHGAGGMTVLGELLSIASPIIIAVLGMTVFIAVVSNIAQTGLLFTAEPLKPSLGKLNPLKKLKQMFFSKNALVELLKTLVKVGALGAICWVVVSPFLSSVIDLPLRSAAFAGELVGRVITTMLIAVGGGVTVIAALDYAWQRRQKEQQMKMTKEEVKRERMEQEGNPLFKGLRRRKHREMSMNQMLGEVQDADVIVTNPTHFAVAIRYKAEEGGAPTVVAKGKDDVALRIRREGIRYGVPVVEQRPLARALFKAVKVGQEIPAELYQAVAEVLAYIYRLSQRTQEA